MKAKLKKLKKQYDGKSVSQCIKLAKDFNKKMLQQGEKLVELLWYLEKTKRFKEYGGYEKLDFNVFISEICLIPYNRYKQIAFAYNWYPEESREFGPQTIQTIRQAVGTTKIPKVLNEIKGAISTTKPKDIVKKREIVAGIIEKHIPKVEVKSTDTKSYWKSEAHRWEKIARRGWDDIKERDKTIEELNAQIARQKIPLENYAKVREALAPMMQ